MSKGAKVLLVDASLGQRTILQRVLGGNGFAVTPLPCLRQAAAALAAQAFDHAVFDLRLPDRNGLDLIRITSEPSQACPMRCYDASSAPSSQPSGESRINELE